MVRLALDLAVQARRSLQIAIASTPRDAPDFLETIARVRDVAKETGVCTMSELARWVGVDRTTLYSYLRQADRQREQNGA